MKQLIKDVVPAVVVTLILLTGMFIGFHTRPACAQTPELDDFKAKQVALRAAQADYDTARNALVAVELNAVTGINIAANGDAILAMRADLDALKARATALEAVTVACRAIAVTAAAAYRSSTTIAGGKLALLPLVECLGRAP